MNIIIGSDHAGFDLKEECRSFIENLGGYSIKDEGVFSKESFDYPKIAHKVAQAVSSGEFEKGLLVCGSGIGMSIVANRYKGVRAALCTNAYLARMSRMHNDANLLSMGERIIGVGVALDILEVFLTTAFEGGRHLKRIDQIDGNL